MDEFKAACEKDFYRITGGKKLMNLAEFIRLTSCQSRYIAVAVFDAIDTTKDGSIGIEEYCVFQSLLCYGSINEKAQFMFSMFDSDNDGWLAESDLETALMAGSIESGRALDDAILIGLVNTLLRLFTLEPSGRISLERFTEVLQGYPDLLNTLKLGSPGKMQSIDKTRGVWARTIKSVRKTRKWIVNRPARFATYVCTTLMLGATFFWQFWKYSGDCSGADLDFIDPVTGVSRREVQILTKEVFNVSMSERDAQYMSFSSEMSKHDPMRCQKARLRILLSWTLPIAKGSGKAMKLVFTLILFPVSRSLMTKLRDTPLRHVFDFDGAISYHKLLGTVGFFLAWVHIICHFVSIYRKQDPAFEKEWCFAHPSEEKNRDFSIETVTVNTPNIGGIPVDLIRGGNEQPHAATIFRYSVVITGILLSVIYFVAALYAFDYPKHLKIFDLKPTDSKGWIILWIQKEWVRLGKHLNDFNNFWYTHHLFVLFYVLLVFHPFPKNILETHQGFTDAWFWILIPVLLYIAERIHRTLQRADNTPLLEIDTLPGKVLSLRIAKPEKLEYKAGQYVMVNCSQISRFEWHPFTLTSAPQDPYLSVHIRAVGDWTTAMYDALKSYKTDNQEKRDLEIGSRSPLSPNCPTNIRIAGPYGAPSQKYCDYQVVVCIGAGIGVTPFASILSNTLHSIRSTENYKTKKIYFHWIVRTRNEASWFASLLKDIADIDGESVLSVCIHITNMKHASDVRMMLLRLAEYEDINQHNSSGVINTSVTRFGRPDWEKVLSGHIAEHQEEAKIGVFYCGPNGLKKTLKKECEKLTQTKSPSFVFHKEIF